MKSLYESILDDEDILIDNTNDYIKAATIYNKIIDNKKRLTKIDLDWINNKIGVYKINGNELEKLIFVIGKEKKYPNISLNWLDVSGIDNMSNLFNRSKFNGDISKWNVSNVEDMSFMFNNSIFNSDISKWKISSKCDTYNMFSGCSIKDKYKPKNIK